MKNGLKWVKQGNDCSEKQRKNILKVENEKKEQQIIHLKKELHTIKKEKVKILPLRRKLINSAINFQ